MVEPLIINHDVLLKQVMKMNRLSEKTREKMRESAPEPDVTLDQMLNGISQQKLKAKEARKERNRLKRLQANEEYKRKVFRESKPLGKVVTFIHGHRSAKNRHFTAQNSCTYHSCCILQIILKSLTLRETPGMCTIKAGQKVWLRGILFRATKMPLL